jgi:hypothetical protein
VIAVDIEIFAGVQTVAFPPHHRFVDRRPGRNEGTEIDFVMNFSLRMNQMLAEKAAGLLHRLAGFSGQSNDERELAAKADIVAPLQNPGVLLDGGLLVNIIETAAIRIPRRSGPRADRGRA